MLNVALNNNAIPESQIKYVREILTQILTRIDELVNWNEEREEEINKWLKRLELTSKEKVKIK